MSVRDDILKERRRTGTANLCLLGVILNRLSPDVAAEVEEAMTDEYVTHTGLSRWFKRNGESVSDNTVRKHRNGECVCECH